MLRRICRRGLMLCVAPAVLIAPAWAGTWFVRHNALPGGDGSSWASAFRTVQEGLAAAVTGDEVWVAKAVYRPGNASSPRSVSFLVPNGVALYGGFAGWEGSLEERDWNSNPTVLSGDLARDDAPGFLNRSDNCYHVVRVGAAGIETLVDGFVISGGYADGSAQDRQGGGILTTGRLTVRNSRIEGNHGTLFGGGIFASNHDLVVEDCVLRGNRAGNSGSAIMLVEVYNPVLSRCSIYGNAGYNEESAASAVSMEDGIRFVVSNCSISGNQGDGLFFIYFGDDSVVVNSTFAHNTGSSIIDTHFGETLTIRNSILWGNGEDPGVYDMTFQFSVAETTLPFPWNQDPRFVDPLGPDGVEGTDDDDLRLACTSPYIDHGNNALALGPLDLAGKPRFLDDPATPDGGGTAPIVDLGAWEFLCDCDDVTSYCTALPNSSGDPAAISWSGSTSIATDDFDLHVEGCPPFRLGIFYYGSTQVEVPLGDGVRCVGGSTFRLPVIQTDANGTAMHQLSFDQPPASEGPGWILEGSTWNFSFFFRDPAGGPAGWNYSDALSVHFCR